MLLRQLQSFHPKEIDLSLDRMSRLCQDLGNPHKRLPPVIHIAGTNGKGSTLAYLKAIFEAAGYRVHRYTSPHLLNFNERIEIAGTPVCEEILEKALRHVIDINQGQPITFFEATTALAFDLFASHPADIVLLETGLGGLFDATNIIENPLLTLISTISYDHQEFLGEHIEDIARAKAGIIKKDCPVIITPQQHPETSNIILEVAHRFNAPLICVPWQTGESYQIQNQALACAAIEQLEGFDILKLDIEMGLLNMRWPGRLEERIIHGRPVLLDGAHNPEGVKALFQSCGPRVGVCAIKARKDASAMLHAAKPFLTHLVVTFMPGEDNMDPSELYALAEQLGISVDLCDVPQQALQRAFECSPEIPVVFGSLYLVTEFMKLVH